jgi:AcrR family transcriptional regulator
MTDLNLPERAKLTVRSRTHRKLTKSERTQAAILDAAFDFLWSNPYRELTVNSLMERTGVSRPTFYQYFGDRQELMSSLLASLVAEIMTASRSWFEDDGDPVALLNEALTGLVDVGYERGPFLRAVADAATTDARLEAAWGQFLQTFDEVVAERIKADQALGLIPSFDAPAVAALTTRMDAYAFIHAFGQHPRQDPEPIRQAVVRMWVSTLYGPEWAERGESELRREAGLNIVPDKK